MSRNDDNDDRYEDDDRYESDDDRYGYDDDNHISSTGTVYTDNDDVYEHGTGVISTGSTGNSASPYVHGYQFSIVNGAVTGITEIEHGYAQQERIEYGETWTVSGNQIVKTEIEHGFTQTATYADVDGDGVFTKVSQTYTLPTTGTSSASPQALASIQGGNDTDDIWSGGSSSEVYYGAVGDDLLHGSFGNDDLYGGNDNDNLYGDEGDDHLIGSNGDDHIYGGSGTDEASYEGRFAEYSLARTATGIQLSDSDTLRDGDDVLESVERIHFEDVSVAFDADGAVGEAYRLYRAAFDRNSDDEGLGYWIAQLENGSSLSSVARAFVASDEFEIRYGENCTDEQFVSLLYNNVLDRDADAAGYQYWLEQLDSNLGREDVLVCFSESPENQNNVAELISVGITYQEWSA